MPHIWYSRSSLRNLGNEHEEHLRKLLAQLAMHMSLMIPFAAKLHSLLPFIELHFKVIKKLHVTKKKSSNLSKNFILTVHWLRKGQ